MADFESALAPQAGGNKIPLSSLINLAISQQRDERDFEQRKKEYTVSQWLGRLKSFEDNPVRYKGYYKILQDKPDVRQVFNDVGIDISEFAPVDPSAEELVAEGTKQAGVQADIFSSPEGKRLRKNKAEMLGEEVKARSAGEYGYARTKTGSWVSVTKGEADDLSVPFYTQAQYDETEDAKRTFSGTYNQLAREYSKYPPGSKVDILHLLGSVMPSGEQLSASETYTKMMANYNKAYAGTPFEPEIQLEEAMFRRIINKESWEDSTGKVWTPEDMRNYLKKSKVLGFPSPYYYFSDLGVDPATIKDDEPLPERRAKTNNLGA